jgi:hypothetical protein
MIIYCIFFSQVVKKHVLFYNKYSEDCDLGFTMYEELPTNRQKVLESFSQKEGS